MKKIKMVSFILRLIFSLALVALPAYVVVYWVTGGHPFGEHYPIAVLAYDGPSLLPVSLLPPLTLLLGFLINLIPTGFYMAILGLLIYLFKQYESEQIFSQKNVKTIRNIGLVMLANKIIEPFYGFLLTYTLTYHNPPGYRFAYLGINIQDITIMLIAVLIILVSWVMAEGYKLHEEQQYTV